MKPCQRCGASTYHISSFESIGRRLARRPENPDDLREWYAITKSCDGCKMPRSLILRDHAEPFRSSFERTKLREQNEATNPRYNSVSK